MQYAKRFRFVAVAVAPCLSAVGFRMTDKIKNSDCHFTGGFIFKHFFDQNRLNVKRFAAVLCPDCVFKLGNFLGDIVMGGHLRALLAIDTSSALSGELTGGISNTVVYCGSPSSMCAHT
jgi:hypothetical protein